MVPIGTRRATEVLAKPPAEGRKAFEAGELANSRDAFSGMQEQPTGGLQPGIYKEAVWGGAIAIPEHPQEVLGVEGGDLRHIFQRDRRGVVGFYPFPGQR